MPKFFVTLTETRTMSVVVEAPDVDAAQELAHEGAHDNGFCFEPEDYDLSAAIRGPAPETAEVTFAAPDDDGEEDEDAEDDWDEDEEE